jgi:hypothetical protein
MFYCVVIATVFHFCVQIVIAATVLVAECDTRASMDEIDFAPLLIFQPSNHNYRSNSIDQIHNPKEQVL